MQITKGFVQTSHYKENTGPSLSQASDPSDLSFQQGDKMDERTTNLSLEGSSIGYPQVLISELVI